MWACILVKGLEWTEWTRCFWMRNAEYIFLKFTPSTSPNFSIVCEHPPSPRLRSHRVLCTGPGCVWESTENQPRHQQLIFSGMSSLRRVYSAITCQRITVAWMARHVPNGATAIQGFCLPHHVIFCAHRSRLSVLRTHRFTDGGCRRRPWQWWIAVFLSPGLFCRLKHVMATSTMTPLTGNKRYQSLWMHKRCVCLASREFHV